MKSKLHRPGFRALYAFFDTVPAVLAALVFTLLVAPRIASAEWPPFGRPIVTAPKGQVHSEIASDGAGGAIVTWQDFRFSKVNIFAQHVLASGDLDAAWPADGRALVTDSLALATADGGQTTPLIVPDGAGGAIVAWLDLRSAVTETDIYAQHVLASGEVDPAWSANGTPLCVIEGIQNSMAMVPDGSGGAVVTWRDGRPGASEVDIYAQHVLASGFVDPGWPANGVVVCGAPGSQESPAIATDGACGAIVTWVDRRNANEFDIFAQHVLGSGAADPAWPVDGRAVCTAPGSQADPTIVSDGAHGAIMAWTDGRADATDHVFAQHVRAAGAVDPAWPVNGRGISSAADLETRPFAVADGVGGAIVTWQGFTTDLNKLSMYAQHVTAAGVVDPAWPLPGRALSTSELQQTNGVIVSDGAGGAIVAWNENHDIMAQHVLASGSLDPTYPGPGRPVVDLPSGQGDPAMVATGGGGAIVSWSDTRGGVGLDIYALQVLESGTSGVPDSPPLDFTFARPSQNPARGPVTLQFALPQEAGVRLVIYDVNGRRVRVLVSQGVGAGEHAIDWDLRDERGEAVGNGIYFARLEVGRQALTQKVISLR